MEHTAGPFREQDLDADPIRQFARWFEQAQAAGVPQPEGMTLATATPDGFPSARMVLLRGVDERGFVFFSNYQSRKGRELAKNPRAALVLYWHDLDRQVRIEGTVEQVSDDESDAYFRSRPPGSRLGAWASRQSEVIPDRQHLERAMEELRKQHPGSDIPRPPHWGGFRVVPRSIEFWQGQPDRLHDRLRYVRTESGWRIERLSP